MGATSVETGRRERPPEEALQRQPDSAVGQRPQTDERPVLVDPDAGLHSALSRPLALPVSAGATGGPDPFAGQKLYVDPNSPGDWP